MSHSFNGFDDAFLLQFQQQQEALAEDMRRRALAAQQAAEAAARELERRTRSKAA